jgi:AraC family transcriptional regulator
MKSTSINKDNFEEDSKVPLNLQIVQGNEKDWLFEQRESQKVHTAYEWEQELFSCIRDGDISHLNRMIDYFNIQPVMVGKLSTNNLRQMQYLAVAFVTLATRSAIQGGMLEMDAYNQSDAYIQEIDQLTTVDKVVDFIYKLLRSLTEKMYIIKMNRGQSKPIKDCLGYIYQNLHNKITLQDLSNVACLSPQYLSSLFKKELGITLSTYILNEKINAAKNMLSQDGLSAKDVSNYLNFSSQSHFINCFKRVSGMTPYEFQRFHVETQ